MKGQRLAPVAKALAALIFMACLDACNKAPEFDTAGPGEPSAPALSLEEDLSDVEIAKRARASALAGKEATKRAIEFAQSASAAVTITRQISSAWTSESPARPKAGCCDIRVATRSFEATVTAMNSLV